MRQMMAPSRPGRVRFLGERLNAQFFREAWSELKKVHWPTRHAGAQPDRAGRRRSPSALV